MKKLILLLLAFTILVCKGQVTVVTLNGSASVDQNPGGTITSYQWIQVGTTPAPCVITNANKAIATVIPANGQQWTPGTYTFQLAVTNGIGLTSTAVTHVTWTSTNPVVDAGLPQTIKLPTNSVQLKAIATVSLGKVKSWAWSQVSGPGSATFNRKDTSTVTVTGFSAGKYVFQCTIVDNFNVTASDTVSLTVLAPDLAPKANAGPDQTISLPVNSVTIGGEDWPKDGTVNWAKVSGPSSYHIISPFSSTTQITGLVAGVYKFRKTVTMIHTDSAIDDVTVTVKKKCSWFCQIFNCCK
jgi:hypothetical protein